MFDLISKFKVRPRLPKFRVLFLAGISIFLSLQIVLVIANEFFFDKIFYQKSSWLGYRYSPQNDPDNLKLTGRFDKYILAKRTEDLNLLFSQIAEPKITNFCGASDQNLIRIRNYTDLKPLTIVVIGDSMTYGMGTEISARFSKVLEQKLNQIIPTKIYTLAEPGNSLEAEYSLYLLAKDYLNPDLVIFGIVENDLILDKFEYPNSARLRNHLKNNCPQPEFSLGNADLINLEWNETLAIYQKSFLPTYSNLCFLRTISKELGQTKNNLFISFFASATSASTNEIDPAISARRDIIFRYKQELENYQNVVIGYFPDQLFKPVSVIEGHLSKEAHQEIAQILFDKIVANLATNNYDQNN